MSDHPPVTPHEGLQPIIDDVWFLKGSVDFKPLVRLQRNMVVLRHDGKLTLVNSIRLDDAGLAELQKLGTIAHVVKIGFHGMDDPFYMETFGATRWAVGDDDDATFPVPGVKVARFELTKSPECALLVERDGGLLITCDSVQHWEPSNLMSFMAKAVTGVMGFKKPAQIGPPWRKVNTPEGSSLKPDFERLAQLPFDKLIGGHGGLAASGAQALLKASIAREF